MLNMFFNNIYFEKLLLEMKSTPKDLSFNMLLAYF